MYDVVQINVEDQEYSIQSHVLVHVTVSQVIA